MEIEAAAPLQKVNSAGAGGQQHLQPSVRAAADNSSQLTLHRFIQRQQAACLSTEIESSTSRYLITLHRTVKHRGVGHACVFLIPFLSFSKIVFSRGQSTQPNQTKTITAAAASHLKQSIFDLNSRNYLTLSMLYLTK